MEDLKDAFLKDNLTMLKKIREDATASLVVFGGVDSKKAEDFVTRLMEQTIYQTSDWQRRLNARYNINPHELFKKEGEV